MTQICPVPLPVWLADAGGKGIQIIPVAHGDDRGEAGADGGLPAGRLAYSVAEVAMITGLSRDLLYDQMRAGRLAYVKVGRRRIISRQHLEAFLARGAA